MEQITRPKPKLVTLSDEAAERIREIIAKGDKPYLRVGVKNGGCAGMEYTMDYAETPDKYDEIIEDKGVQIIIAANAVLFLIGTEIDVETTKFHTKFTFRNPNQTDACGCGESVTIVPAQA
jgi:iron-sulfur cluster assembly protein